MGYSRNYQKYWDEKKRKRDEDVNNSSHTGVVLPQADAFMNGGSRTSEDTENTCNNQSTSDARSNDSIFLECNEFSSDDESCRPTIIDTDDLSASSVASSRSCGTFDTTDQSSDKVCGHAGTGYFNSKTYQKSHVPMRESFPLSC
jgi:hypothetical protein